MNQQALKIFRALSNKTRGEIIKKLLNQKEISCQQLSGTFSLSQPTLSHHFNKLIDTNILQVRKMELCIITASIKNTLKILV